MKVYDYKQINNCIICGSIENGLDTFIENVINRLPNKKSISDRIHPKEIERQKRIREKQEREIREIMEAREAAMGRPHLEWRNPFESNYESMKRKMRSSNNWNGLYENMVIVVCGSCGIGGKDINYYLSKFEELNNGLADNNAHILFVRGSKDDPQLFNNETINLSNVKTIPDYSVLMLESFNCLCIGGSISLDREWKKSQEERVGRKMYWENENFEYKEKEIKEILNNYDIACVITNTCPSFVFPGTNSFNKSSWALKDKSILKDILNERKLMDKVYEKIMDKNKKPFAWIYSKYGISNQNITNDILFMSLSKQAVLSFNNLVESNFGVSFKKKLSYNQEIMDELIKKFTEIHSYTLEDVPWHDDDNLEVEDEHEGEEIEDDAFGNEVAEEENDFIDEMLNNEEAQEEGAERNGIAYDANFLDQMLAVDTATIAAADLQAPRVEYEPVRDGQMHFEMPHYIGELNHPNR